MILFSFQGVCQDHQASLHSPIQPLHPECGCAKRHSQHQQRGGGTSTRAWHRRWCPQPAEQAAGCLTAHIPVGVIHIQSINACRVTPKHRCRDTACVSPFVSTMNVHCFWQNALLSPLHGIRLIQFTEVHKVCLATYISKMHKPKELLNQRHCFASVVLGSIGFCIPNINALSWYFSNLLKIHSCYKHRCGFLILLLPLLLYIIMCIFLYSSTSTSSSSHLIFLTSVMCIKCTLVVLIWCMYHIHFCVLLREIMKMKTGVIRMFSWLITTDLAHVPWLILFYFTVMILNASTWSEYNCSTPEIKTLFFYCKINESSWVGYVMKLLKK